MAMPKLPEDVELKLRHATRHLQTLNAQMHSFGDRDPYSDVAELHKHSGQRGRVVMRMVVNREPLREWSLTIGDVAFNLRATLDYAALALWRTHSGEPTAEQIDQIQFPIYTTQKGFKGNRKRLVGGVHPDVMRIMRLAQPYQGRDDPENHLLARLQRINNFDKHRVLHTTHGIMEDSEIEILDRENVVVTDQSSLRYGGFENGDPIATFDILAVAPNPKLEVKLKSTYGIAFDKEGPGRGENPTNLLNDIRLYIRDDLLTSLEPYF